MILSLPFITHHLARNQMCFTPVSTGKLKVMTFNGTCSHAVCREFFTDVDRCLFYASSTGIADRDQRNRSDGRANHLGSHMLPLLNWLRTSTSSFLRQLMAYLTQPCFHYSRACHRPRRHSYTQRMTSKKLHENIEYPYLHFTSGYRRVGVTFRRIDIGSLF